MPDLPVRLVRPLRPEERQQVFVELLLVRAHEAMRRARIDLQGCVLDELGGEQGRVGNGHDLIIYQSLQFLLYHLRNLGNLLALVLGKQRDEAVIGHEGPAFFVLVDDQLQWSIQASFWHVPGHLSSKERIANGILGGPARFSYQGEEEAVFHLKKESQPACSNMRFNRLGELLPGRVSGSRLLPNFRPILRRAEPSLQRANNLFIGLVRLNDNVLNSNRCRVSHVETPILFFSHSPPGPFLVTGEGSALNQAGTVSFAASRMM